MKKILNKIIVLALLIVLSTQTTYTNASAKETESVTIEYLDDGSYLETTITNHPSVNLFGTSTYATPGMSTLVRTKTTKHYNASNEVLWYLQVKGTFLFGHGYAQCTKSEAFAKSYARLWKLTDKKASKSGNVASAYVNANLYMTFLSSYPSRIIKQTVNLTCSSLGKFS